MIMFVLINNDLKKNEIIANREMERVVCRMLIRFCKAINWIMHFALLITNMCVWNFLIIIKNIYLNCEKFDCDSFTLFMKIDIFIIFAY